MHVKEGFQQTPDFWAKIGSHQTCIISYIETVSSEQILLPCTMYVFVFGGFVITKKHIKGHRLSVYSPGTSAIFVKNTFL